MATMAMDYTGFTKSINTLTDLFKQSIGLQKNLLKSFDTSAIARHSASPLEKSLDTIRESSVSFNEKTLRWHDDQTNRMVKGTDPRIVAQKTMGEKKSDGDNDSDNDSLLEKLTAIEEHTKNISESLYGDKQVSAEETMEEEAYQENRDKDVAKAAKERKNTLGGIWEAIKEGNKENWFVKHWKKIALGLFVLFAPLKWLKKLWGWAVDFWEMPIWGKILTALGLIATYLLLKKGITTAVSAGATAVSAGVGVAQKGFKTFMQKRSAASMMSPAQKAMSAQRAGPGLLSRTGTAIKTGASKAVGGVKAGAKAVGGKLGSMASSTKGIFSSLVKKFGSAGKWIMKLGSRLIMPLVTTPIGWAILAGLAIGGLAYVFWDDLKKIWENITGFVSKTFSKVSEFASNMVGSARSMLGNFLRSVGAGMIADWIDPDGADKSKPAKEFTWKNFGLELYNIYTGLWKEVLGIVQKGFKAVRGIAASFAESMGMPDSLVSWIRGKEEEEKEDYHFDLSEEEQNAIPGMEERAAAGSWYDFEKTDKGKEYLKTFKDPETGKLSGKGRKRARAAWEAGGVSGETAEQIPPTDTPTDTGTTAPTDTPPVQKTTISGLNITSKMEDKWAEHRGIEQRGKRGKKGKRRKAKIDLMEQMRQGHSAEIREALGDKLYTQLTKDSNIGGEDKHKAVKVSQANMSGVSWNKLGGRDTIENAILTTWNRAGVSAAPTFTSGFRDKDHPLSKTNPQSQHIQRTAFDLRSSDLGSHASTVWADISSKFAGMGLRGQWEKGSVNKDKRTGEHFHFQLAAKGFEGVVGKDGPKGFIAGEAGPEFVKIQPLHPNQQGATLTAGQQQTASLSGGSAGGNVGINTTTVNNTTLGESTMVVGQQRPVGNPKMGNLTT